MLKFNEAETRRTLINPILAAAGWSVVSYDKTKELKSYINRAIREYTTNSAMR